MRGRARRHLTRRQATGVASGLLVLASGGLVVLSSSARADISYTGHAEAYGFRTTATNDAFPLGFVFEGDAPVSTADLSSLGDSQALAAGPYPGTTAASTPGALGGVLGVPLPNYPVVAQATAGDDTAVQNFPGLALRAEAGPLRSVGDANIGSAAQGAQSVATVDATKLGSEGVTAEGNSRLEALALLDYLHFQRVESRAITTLDPYGKRVSKSDLRIDGITAPGLTFAMPPQTPATVPLPNPLPGTPQPPALQFPPVPLPGGGTTYNAPELGFRNGQFVVTFTSGGVEQNMPVPFDTVAQAFKAIGATVTYQQQQLTPNGVIAPMLTFVTAFPAPPDNPFGVKSPTPVTLELGRASASVDGAAIPDSAFGSGVDASGGPVSGVPGAVAPDAAGLSGVLPATDPGGVPSLTGATGGVTAPRPVSLASGAGSGSGSPGPVRG
jgi:hypothetical protein